MKVLVMIPAYNEAPTIAQVVEDVLDLNRGYDVVVVDDGSSDDTPILASKAGARVISLPFHMGGAMAILAGYLLAIREGYDFLLKIDGDGQHRARDLPKLLEPVLRGNADIAIGSRYVEGDFNDHDSILKQAGRAFSSTVVTWLTKMKVTDVTSGLRAWNRSALLRLAKSYLSGNIPDDSVFWLYETTRAAKLGLRIAEVPVVMLPRRVGRSKSYSPRKMLRYPFNLIKFILQEAI